MEAVRWYFISETSLGADSNFCEKEMQHKIEAELADTLGNLVKRCTAKSLNPTRKVPALR